MHPSLCPGPYRPTNKVVTVQAVYKEIHANAEKSIRSLKQIDDWQK